MANQETNGARAVLAADAILQWKADPEIRNRYPTITDYVADRSKIFDLELIRPFRPRPSPVPIPNNLLSFSGRKSK